MNNPRQKSGDLGHICVAIGNKDVAEALAAAKKAAPYSDVIEIRLDCLENPAVEPFISELDVPLLFTCRASWEGGEFEGDESSRLELLGEAVSCRAAYVDLELRSPDSSFAYLHSALKGSTTRLIVSNHDFKQTPSSEDLITLLHNIKDRGANIAKIVTTAHEYQDVLRVLNLQTEAARLDLPLAAFCMGKTGVISRLATLTMGGYMTYCSAKGKGGTAPGQISVRVMREILDSLALV